MEELWHSNPRSYLWDGSTMKDTPEHLILIKTQSPTQRIKLMIKEVIEHLIYVSSKLYLKGKSTTQVKEGWIGVTNKS